MRKLILDVDMGIDDALALAYALASPEVELVGVTTVFGNVSRDRSAANCLAMLELLGHPEAPVVLGADRALAAHDPYAGAPAVHGADGVGGIAAQLPAPRHGAVGVAGAPGTSAASNAPAAPGTPENAAVAFLLDAARRHGKDLLYVPTGPLTNLAHALQRDAEVLQSIGGITVMGGALTVGGNVTPVAEANVYADPEAADAVLRSGLPLTMVGLDVTHRVVLTRAEVMAWWELGTPAARAFSQMTAFYLEAYARSNPELGGCALHDPLAVAVAIDPALVRCLPLALTVDLAGPLRGRTIGNIHRLRDPALPTKVALTVDASRFESRFTTRLRHILSTPPKPDRPSIYT